MLAVSIRTGVGLIAQLDDRYVNLATHDYAGPVNGHWELPEGGIGTRVAAAQGSPEARGDPFAVCDAAGCE